MGELVAAFGLSHTAQMARAAAAGASTQQVQRVCDAWAEVRRRIEAARPDLLVVVASEHLKSFSLDNFPTFCLGIGERSTGWGDGGLPAYEVQLHPEFARTFLEDAIEEGFDLSFSHRMQLDHGFMTPLHFLTPHMNVPVVPLFQNCTTPPVPLPKRCYDLGGALRRTIERRPKGERVAVLGTGGLSHWLGVKEMGRINADFDREWLNTAASGGGAELAARSIRDVRAEAGNGGQEILNWMTMLGTCPGAQGEVIAYEPVAEWITGIGFLEMRV